MISREKKKEYIKAGGSFCINCGSGNMSAGRVESEGREAWQPVQCYDCGSEWNDIFRLIGVDDIVLPEDDPMIPQVRSDKESADGSPRNGLACTWSKETVAATAMTTQLKADLLSRMACLSPRRFGAQRVAPNG